MERKREAYQKDFYNITASHVFMVFPKRLKLLGVFRHSVLKLRNTGTT